MKIYAEIITPWIGDGLTKETAHRPRLNDEYPVDYCDTTGQPAGELPPQPNMYVVYVDVEESALTQIEGDATYYVLYREGDETGVPDSNEFGQLRAYLGQQGADQEQIKNAVGNSVGGRTRAEIVEDLKVWLRTLNKAP